jgi:hypothetical protein
MVPAVGISNTNAEKVVQLRPPNLAMPNVYGMRAQPPARVATAPSRSLSLAENP